MSSCKDRCGRRPASHETLLYISDVIFMGGAKLRRPGSDVTEPIGQWRHGAGRGDMRIEREAVVRAPNARLRVALASVRLKGRTDERAPMRTALRNVHK
ncbi:unnamed protein product [Arctia plantaginis]|uniref:Uncharacterized protein n=1 Tax=Arctia plantaginis TaxID=874455 RepID=A0A8S1AP08_ARCPL|nr:unnamed protein product [Arctia plantaginis]